MSRKGIYIVSTVILIISLIAIGMSGCKGSMTTVTNTSTKTQVATVTNVQTSVATTTTTSTATATATTTAVATVVTTAMMSFDPIVVNKTTGEISFMATVKKTEHKAGTDPQQLSRPPILICENMGSALPSAALQSEPGVTGEKLTNALMQIGLVPGQTLKVGDVNKFAVGDAVKIYIDVNGTRSLLDDLMKSAYPAVKTGWVFDGSFKTQWTIGCGCLVCGGSGPGTILANTGYSSSDQAAIGPTLHAALVTLGLKDGDQVKIVIKKG